MKIAVLAGGTSTERDVSLITGKMVYKALKENGHQVVLVDVFMGYPGEDYKTLFTSDIDFSEQIRGRKEAAKDSLDRMYWISAIRRILYLWGCTVLTAKMVRCRQHWIWRASVIQEPDHSVQQSVWIRRFPSSCSVRVVFRPHTASA